MPAETTLSFPSTPTRQEPSALAKSLRSWPAVAFVALFWGLFFIVAGLNKSYFFGFLFSMANAALLTLLCLVWWWTNRRIRLPDRLYGFFMILATGAVAAPLTHPSIGVFGLLTSGVPVVLTVWTLWLLLVPPASTAWYRLGSLVVVCLSWGLFTLIRIEGVNGELQADMRWRWSPTAEERFLAEKAKKAGDNPDSSASSAARWAPSVTAADWPEFRGPQRDGVIRGVTIATDWDTNPPRLVWRQPIGPAWSSVIVVGDRLFTQEQRGEQETVVCYDAAKGKEIWVHEDPVRFWETVSGAGPRATPTFAGGRVFTLGARGLLNCLDAATGQCHWSRDITAVAGAKVPMWGFSGSPLVVDEVVIVFAGGDGDKSLLGYHTESGELAWTAPAGPSSYSSPQRTTIAGKPQCLFLSDHGLIAVDPATGMVLWQHGAAMPGAPRTLQPHLLGDTQLVVGTLSGPGMSLLDVTPDGASWKTVERWATTQVKPEFPDFVVHEGHAYGFDLGIFCCLDLANGKRTWKGGRYGRGQVMLLADQPLLLVLSETGEAILLATNPKQQEERGRFQALNGKTWNHPVISHGRLFVRNAEEIACYELIEK
jgi:outer membrane protein assembly factor BamB